MTERRAVKRQVDDFVDLLRDRYGLDEDDLKEVAEDLRFMRKYRKRVEHFTLIFGGSIAVGLASGLVWAVWEGFRVMVKR